MSQTKEYFQARYIRNKAKMDAQSRLWRINNRARFNALQTKWKRLHPEDTKIRIREWRKLNPKAVARQKARHYEKHKARINLRTRAWAKARHQIPEVRAKIIAATSKYAKEHPEVARAKVRRWAAKNPDKVRECSSRRSALKRSATVNLAGLKRYFKLVKSRATSLCYYCGNKIQTKDCHFDHIIPLCKGGEHSVRNLCVSCSACNLSKSTKLVGAWVRVGQQVLSL